MYVVDLALVLDRGFAALPRHDVLYGVPDSDADLFAPRKADPWTGPASELSKLRFFL